MLKVLENSQIFCGRGSLNIQVSLIYHPVIPWEQDEERTGLRKEWLRLKYFYNYGWFDGWCLILVKSDGQCEAGRAWILGFFTPPASPDRIQ